MDIKQKTAEFIKTHPKMSYKTFTKQSRLDINSCYYYQIRKTIFPQGLRSNAVNTSCVYLTAASIPTQDLLQSPRKALMDIIKGINSLSGLKLDALENIKEQTIEIRQIGLK